MPKLKQGACLVEPDEAPAKVAMVFAADLQDLREDMNQNFKAIADKIQVLTAHLDVCIEQSKPEAGMRDPSPRPSVNSEVQRNSTSGRLSRGRRPSVQSNQRGVFANRAKTSAISRRDNLGGEERASSAARLSALLPRPSAADSAELKSKRAEWSVAVWRFLEDPNSSCGARYFNYTVHLTLLVSVAVAFAESLALNHVEANVMRAELVIQPILEVIFLIELVLRFICTPYRKIFWLNLFNIIDLISVLPLPVHIWNLAMAMQGDKDIFSNFSQLQELLVMVPTLRLLKLLRRFEKFHLLISAFRVALEALPVLLFTLAVIALIFSSLIYYIEPRHHMRTLEDALWFTIVTMSTVGYGDQVPVTFSGRAVATVLIFVSVLYMAVPIGIIGQQFGKVWEDRERLLAIQQMRDCVRRAGYSLEDLHDFFLRLDINDNHELDFSQFKQMCRLMQIDARQKTIEKIFMTFDEDGQGSVDFREFIKVLFPTTHSWLGAHVLEMEYWDTMNNMVSEKFSRATSSQSQSPSPTSPNEREAMGG